MKRFALAAVVAAITGIGAAAQQPPVYQAGDKSVQQKPQVIAETKPSYTAEAMRKKISGSVEMTTVIGVDGRPSDIKIVRSLDSGLDKNAVAALDKWRFKPAMKDGKPVRMLVTIEMSFTLRDDRVYDKTSASVKGPVVLKHTPPAYTPEAMRAKIEGVVEIEGVVGVDGRLRRPRSGRSGRRI
jgi:TonB family protein